jgi:large repetitive protein
LRYGYAALAAGLLLASVAGLAPALVAQTAHFSYAAKALSGGFDGLGGVAVDTSGNVYVTDGGSQTVREMPAGCASSASVKTLGGGFNLPSDVAVDGNGNVYVADADNNAVKEMPTGCVSSTCVKTLGGGIATPKSVAVDVSGNVYVPGLYDEAVKKIPAGCTSSACLTEVIGKLSALAVAVDFRGNLYVTTMSAADNELQEVMPEGVNLFSWKVGSTSAAMSLTFTFDSGGTIQAPAVLTQGAAHMDFGDAGNGTCTTNGARHAYARGDTCTVNVTFHPHYAGSRCGAVVLKKRVAPTLPPRQSTARALPRR